MARSVVIVPHHAVLRVDDRDVRVANLTKVFWAELGITKGDLLQYCARVAGVLIPHLVSRAMVMKRYPPAREGSSFFMKRAPMPRPEWIRTCRLDHGGGDVIDCPVIDDRASVLWLVNLGCIDLSQWYARCDDVDCPDCVHFDLDPGTGVPFDRVRETGLVLKEDLDALAMPAFVKTSGSKGLHVSVPIVRGPTQKAVWTFAKALANERGVRHGGPITTEYRVAKRPARRVLVDYNQNAWGRTLASLYSVRPRPDATVSTPLTWNEVEGGARTEDFTIMNVPARTAALGDSWKPLLSKLGRFDLGAYV